MVSPRKRQKVYDPPRFVGRPLPDEIAKTASLLAKVERQSGPGVRHIQSIYVVYSTTNLRWCHQ